MNDLEQLRSTLDRHASDVVDHDVHARVGAVRHRVGVTRRRRRGAAAGTAALALAVVAGLGLIRLTGETPDVEPATPRLVGLLVPSTQESLGYTYTFTDGAEGTGVAAVDLPASDRSRLVSWGTAGPDDQVTVTGLDGAPELFDVNDFTDVARVPTGVDVTVSVRGEGELALAVYEITDDAPAGTTRAAATFRESAAGAQLLGAAIGDPGESEVSVDPSAAGRALSYRYFCADAPRGAVMHVEDADGEFVTGGCTDGLPFDPGGAGGLETTRPTGRDDVVRLWVTQGEEGPPVTSDEIVVGLGIYAAPPPAQQVGSLGVVELVEHEGHLFRLARVVRAGPGAREAEVEGTSSPQPLLVLGFASGVGRDSEVVMGMQSQDSGGLRSQGIDAGNAPIGLLSSGDRAFVRLFPTVPGADVPADAELAIALYERAD